MNHQPILSLPSLTRNRLQKSVHWTIIGITNTGTRLVITRGTTPALTGGAYDYSAENCAMATFSFTPKTGLFKGTFKLYYDYTLNERLQHKAVSVSYAGVLTPVRAGAFAAEPAGQGYYLVPDNNPLWKKVRLKRSYRITLEEEL